ncbi:preprotein translocase subunit YajC [Saccharopolyspora taberi]|uniref:Preprotein translocase subunit YajC n=1 Tax=Saccharopolyspora taberi TaxID=60895 RepID=A0ABN3VG86_9PSEU
MESLIFPLLIALLAVPLFLQARKQKRAMQEQQKLQSSLTTGDRVMTTSGLFGTVVATSDDSIDLEIAPGLTTTWVRAAVREKVSTDADDAATEETSSDDEQSAAAPAESKAETTESKAEVAQPIEQQQKTN